MQREQDTKAGMTDSDTAGQAAHGISKLTLILTPASMEQRFWRSVKLLRLLDIVGLFNSVMLNVMLIRKFGFGRDEPNMLWHFLPVLAYLSAGLVQLAVIFLRPELHQSHRFAIYLSNRLVKAATVTWAAINMSQTDVMNHFTGTLNSVPLAIAGEHSTTAYMKILRTVASLPLLWVSHAVNFLLPFWLLLPLQLYTLLAVSKVIPAIVCVLLGQPPHILQPAAVIAAYVHGCIKLLTVLAVPVFGNWRQQAGGSGGRGDFDPQTKDLLVLVAVTFTLILVVIPCAVAYHVELLWKRDFLRVQGDSDSTDSPTDAKPQPVSLAWVTFDVVCLALLLCESIIHLAPALRCECQPQ